MVKTFVSDCSDPQVSGCIYGHADAASERFDGPRTQKVPVQAEYSNFAEVRVHEEVARPGNTNGGGMQKHGAMAASRFLMALGREATHYGGHAERDEQPPKGKKDV